MYACDFLRVVLGGSPNVNITKVSPLFIQIFSHSNIWTTVAKMHQKSPMAELDWAEMEGLFCQQQPAGGTGINGNPAAPSQAGTKISNGTLMTPGTPDTERKKRETSEVICRSLSRTKWHVFLSRMFVSFVPYKVIKHLSLLLLLF